MKHVLLAGLALLAFPHSAAAQEAASAPAATPAPEEPALCTDRPTKAYAACTVPAGRIQIEADLFNYTRLDLGGDDRVETLLYTNPTVKIGLGANTDVQFNIAPLVELRSRVNGVSTSDTGVGDLFVRLKQRLTDGSSPFQFALIPYVKAPTAPRGIGNRDWEGGVVATAQFSLPHGVTLTFVPEIDLLADSDDPSSRHVQFQAAANVGFALSPKVTLYGELWAAQNDDPVATVRQYSADVAVAWLAGRNLQLDAGANFGLNEATPGVQAYVGISTRF